MTDLRAEKLVKRYKNRTVVNGVSLAVRPGEAVGLLGPNGAGKTTSFYLMVGLVAPTSGGVFIGDQDITGAPMHLRARAGIGYLPQEASVFRKLTVEQNVLAILQTRRELDTSAQRAQLDGLLAEFNLDHLRQSLGASLSGGERRRLEIARSLAAQPKYILLDEPFAGVDPISVVDIQHIVSQLCERGIGILITDHNVRETLNICHRAYILNSGEVIAQGKPDEILENSEVRQVYLGEKFKL